MMRSLVFLSCVGAAIYALLVLTNKMTPVVPDGTKAEVVARETRLKVWGPYLPDRSLNWLATTPQVAPPQQKIISSEIAAARFPPAKADQTVTSSNQVGKRLASFEAEIPARDHEGFWFVVSRAAWVHAGPSVSSPIVHAYRVGTELKVIGQEQGWFRVLDPTTSRTGWIYERYYLQAIPGPGQIQFAVRQWPSPVKVALWAPEPKPLTRIQKSRPKQKITKPKREQRIRLASARVESVASIMERAFRRN
jgi:Bacterial SH3 domain